MRVIILAAGTGSRLGRFTDNKTKGMVNVAGKPLIDHLLNFLDLSCFDEIIVVGGYCFSVLEDYLLQRNLPNLTVVENKNYLKGNIFTLKTALDTFSNDSFLLCNADHIYPAPMFEYMKSHFNGITAMCDHDRILESDDMKVKTWDDGKTVKDISKGLDDFDYGYIGMTYVDKEKSMLYRQALEETIRERGDNAVVENILDALGTNPENAPEICDLSGFGWYEIDDSIDLKKTEEALQMAE